MLRFSLPICMIGTLMALTANSELGLWMARPALLIYLITQWPRQGLLAKGLQTVAVLLSLLVAVFHSDPLPILLDAWDRFCFFATFVSALGLLRVSAMRSRLIRDAGQVLIRQRPTWRYPTLSLGSALFGMIVNIGVLNLFGAMIQRSNSLKAAGGDRAIQAVRERRMIMAMLRGFSLAPLVSPLGVTLAVILSSMPQLSWSRLAPVAFPTAAIVFALGWALDWWLRPRHLTAPVVTRPSPEPLFRFIALALGITVLVFVVSVGLDVRLPVAVLIACPLSAVGWMAVQRRRLGGGTGVVRAVTLLGRHSRLIFGASRNEIAVLGGSAFLGGLLIPLVDQAWLGDLLIATGLHGAPAAVAAMLVVLLLAQVGLNPIVSVTLIAGLFADTHVIGLEPQVLAVALMSAWSLAMISSPFTAAMMVLAQLTGRSPYTLAWRWDGLFFLLLLPLISAWLFLVDAFY